MNNLVFNRDNIYIGEVVNLYTVKIKNQRIIPEMYIGYRTVLFNMTKDYLCNDLIYDSPNYPVLNYTDNDTYINILKENDKMINSRIVVIDALNIGSLLEKLGFNKKLTVEDIIYIKNVVFNKKTVEDKCYQFGLIPRKDKKQKKIYDGSEYYNNNKYQPGAPELYQEMKPYRNAILKYGNDKKSAIFRSGICFNYNAFKPFKKEGKVKKKSYGKKFYGRNC